MKPSIVVTTSVVATLLGGASRSVNAAEDAAVPALRAASVATELQEAHTAGAKLKLNVDRSKVDLERHRLEVTMNRRAQQVVVKVYDEEGALITEETAQFNGKPAGSPLVVQWKQSSGRKIAKVEVYGYDMDDNWVGIAMIPWSVTIPHEEVLFETDRAAIASAEVPKLTDSLERITSAVARYQELGSIQLFIAGHTDTVGTAAYNMDLSRRRAQAIAAWFVKRGLTIPVAFEGFGESSPLVKTGDEVDEPKNRRVDYILAIEPPRTKSGGQPAWKYINR